MTQPPSLVNDPKRALREQYFAIRAAITVGQARDAAEAVAQGFMSFLASVAFNKKPCIAGYIPVGSELDVLPLLGMLDDAGYPTALPRIHKEHAPLVFHAWQKGDRLEPCAFHALKEPLATASEVIPDSVIVPLLAFDRSGGRLGFGGGYYDRTIENLRKLHPQVLCIGVGYACQESEMPLPQEPTDQKLDGIVTEEGYIGVETK